MATNKKRKIGKRLKGKKKIGKVQSRRVGAVPKNLGSIAAQGASAAVGIVGTKQVLTLVDDLASNADVKGVTKFVPVILAVGMFWVAASVNDANLRAAAIGSGVQSTFNAISKFAPATAQKLGIGEVPMIMPNVEVTPVIVEELPTMDISGITPAMAGITPSIAQSQDSFTHKVYL